MNLRKTIDTIILRCMFWTMVARRVRDSAVNGMAALSEAGPLIDLFLYFAENKYIIYTYLYRRVLYPVKRGTTKASDACVRYT